jgi:MobA/MobL family
VAKYFLLMKVLSRNKGSSVIRAAAYRAGERILESRTGRTHDYTSRHDVVEKEIRLPSEFTNNGGVDWARDRSTLWSVVDSNPRRDARLASEVLVILPPELSAVQRTELVRNYAQELADRYRSAVDFAVHEPRENADPRNHHAHMLMTAREVTPEGMGRRTALSGGDQWRTVQGLGSWREELPWMRERWAHLTNEALHGAGLEARVDHRSFKAQGLDVEPTATIPQKIYYTERRTGVGTHAGDEIRAFHRERVEARAQGKEALELVLQRQREQTRSRLAEYAIQRAGQPKKRLSPEAERERRIQRQRDWRSANGETYNQKRREQYREKVQAGGGDYDRQREALRRRQRELYHANVEANRKKRENYADRMRRLEKGIERIVELREGVAKAASISREQFPQSATAEQSARNWAAYRERQQAEAALQQNAKQTVSHERELEKGREVTSRGLDYDAGL